MIKHICPCGYIYNPEYGDLYGDIEKGTKFEDIPTDWVCPICGLPKSSFEEHDKKLRSKFNSFK